MTQVNQDPKGAAYTVSVDAAAGISTGISAADRARTVRTLADPRTGPADLTRPGHVFPLRARQFGVLERPGHTEAAVDLARLAGLQPAGGIVEIVRDDGSVARLPELREFAHEHGLVVISIADLIAYRRWSEHTVTRVAETRPPTRYGEFRATGYRDEVTGTEHVALILGEPGGDDVLVRLHSECLTGDAFGSLRCDCGGQLEDALRRGVRGVRRRRLPQGPRGLRHRTQRPLPAHQAGPDTPPAVPCGATRGPLHVLDAGALPSRQRSCA